jgi:P-type Ca2+ transporter type 2C
MKDLTKDVINEIKWYALEVEQVIEKLKVDPDQGLSDEEVHGRLQRFGENKIPEMKDKNPVLQFLKHFDNVLIYVLIVAGIITALMNHWVDTWVILGVVIINGFIGYIQEGKAEKALESIKKMLSLKSTVVREGEKTELDAQNLVPGDIVLLKSGDKIPADLRIIKSKSLRAEESALTGESTEVSKTPDPEKEDTLLADRKCMLYSGTVVNYGEATGVVTATGLETEIGKITTMISGVEDITTPLIQQIERFGKKLAILIIGLTLVFFSIGYFFHDYPVSELLLIVIGIVVASIPEGLPAIITIILAIGVQRMAKRHAIIRKLPSVETLGSVSVICSDKTGTLTKNEMTAKAIVTSNGNYEIGGSGYKPEGKVTKEDNDVEVTDEPVLKQLFEAVKACNNAEISEIDNGDWKLEGTPTEGALMTLAHKTGFSDYKPERLDSIPFESEHKYMATLHKLEDKRVIFVKGAPERILEMSAKQLNKDGQEEIDREFWQEQIKEIASKGQRVIGVAFKESERSVNRIDPENVETELIFLGVIGIIDPARDEVLDSIKECREAGIQVKMITGDHAITATAIAKNLTITDNDDCVTGNELEKMGDEELIDVVKNNSVFARTSPEHKIRIVKALQADNQFCAMTGDGVNDAPALKQANIGIAMGIKGTEVTKDASEMVLADDNFASIVNAVEEGRTVYDNIRKALLFLLPTNGAEALVLIAAIIIGSTMPIAPVQILWVNMVTAVTLALALSFEPMEQQVMKKPPRHPDSTLIDAYFLWRIIYVSILIGGISFGAFKLLMGSTGDEELARTIAVNTLVAGQLFYLFNCRKIYQSSFNKDFLGNKYAFYAAGILVILQIIFTYMPFMNNVFGTTPLQGKHWLYPIIGGIVVLVIVEIEKTIFNRLKNVA